MPKLPVSFFQIPGRRTGSTANTPARNSESSWGQLGNSSTMRRKIKVRILRIYFSTAWLPMNNTLPDSLCGNLKSKLKLLNLTSIVWIWMFLTIVWHFCKFKMPHHQSSSVAVYLYFKASWTNGFIFSVNICVSCVVWCRYFVVIKNNSAGSTLLIKFQNISDLTYFLKFLFIFFLLKIAAGPRL